MDKKYIELILDDERALENFTRVLIDAIIEDDEPMHKKGRQLLLHSLNNENADDFFIAICGWNIDSLIEQMQDLEI